MALAELSQERLQQADENRCDDEREQRQAP